MSLLQNLRDKLTAARREGDRARLSVLQVVLGDVAQVDARGRALGRAGAGDDDVERAVRKVIGGNADTLAIISSRPGFEVKAAELREENRFLQGLLPPYLTEAEIVAALADFDARAVANDGAATGAAVRHLKSKNLKCRGEEVAAVVKQMRTQG